MFIAPEIRRIHTIHIVDLVGSSKRGEIGDKEQVEE
jgi:hypothetical protein